MAEKPILFSTEMVRALLEGRKTQTRLVVKPQPGDLLAPWPTDSSCICFEDVLSNLDYYVKAGYCPYGVPGDTLWVRETWMPDFPRNGEWPDVQFFGCKPMDYDIVPEKYKNPQHCIYRASWGSELSGWTPSIHMPRWASRITLRVTGVRVERLQEISEKDAMAEGVRGFVEDGCFVYEDYVHGRGTWTMSARDSFATLWQSINGPESWAANPWVWVVEFEKEAANG